MGTRERDWVESETGKEGLERQTKEWERKEERKGRSSRKKRKSDIERWSAHVEGGKGLREG